MVELLRHSEHGRIPVGVGTERWPREIPFRPHLRDQREKQPCLQMRQDEFELSYYVGCDWLVQGAVALQVRPKLDGSKQETDVMAMLMTALDEAESLSETENLLQVRFDAPYLALEQKQDQLTPFLVMQFVQVVKRLVKKGLRRSYFPVRRNLNARVKGKVLVADTLKHNRLRQKPLHTYCRYDEFGYDSLENRLIKRGLRFAQRYLDSYPALSRGDAMRATFGYVFPAFVQVSDQVDLHEVKHTPVNPFYPEYAEAIRLARLLIRRFGYQLSEVSDRQVVPTPPYWIDMSKLFELYVLGLLRQSFQEIRFQFKANKRYPDYLLLPQGDRPGIVADAKYKTNYGYEFPDMAQVSGYTRNQKVREALGTPHGRVAPGLIIYPKPRATSTISPRQEDWEQILAFEQMYKVGVGLPLLPKQG